MARSRSSKKQHVSDTIYQAYKSVNGREFSSNDVRGVLTAAQISSMFTSDCIDETGKYVRSDCETKKIPIRVWRINDVGIYKMLRYSSLITQEEKDEIRKKESKSLNKKYRRININDTLDSIICVEDE